MSTPTIGTTSVGAIPSRPFVQQAAAGLWSALSSEQPVYATTGDRWRSRGLGERLTQSERLAEVWLAIADEHAESNVKRGENSGRRLAHVMVARSLERIGETDPGQRFSREVRVERPGRVIVFLQERDHGRVLGVAST